MQKTKLSSFVSRFTFHDSRFMFLLLIIFIFSIHLLWAQENNEDIIIKVLLSDNAKSFSVSSPGGIIFKDSSDKEYKFDDTEEYIITAEEDGIKVSKQDNLIFESGDNLVIQPVDLNNKLIFNSKSYRGYLEVKKRDGKLRVINCVFLEEYLYGVLPQELDSIYIEVLKAQAILARTYAISKFQKNRNKDYYLKADSSDQVYRGSESETKLAKQATDETRGFVLTFKNKLANSVLYCSTCGGHTASNEEVFLTTPVRYLNGTPCNLEGFLNFLKSEDLSNLSNSPELLELLDKLNNNNIDIQELKKPLCSDSNFFSWEVRLTPEEILSNLPAKTAENMGKITSINILKKGSSQRVTELEIEAENHNVIIKGDDIRKILRFKNDKGENRILYSLLFDISFSNSDGCYIIKGNGWGHGLGLCQFGAVELARLGANYETILKYYFNGTEVNPAPGI